MTLSPALDTPRTHVRQTRATLDCALFLLAVLTLATVAFGSHAFPQNAMAPQAQEASDS